MANFRTTYLMLALLLIGWGWPVDRPAQAQWLSGSAEVGTSAGLQSNAYLDPMLREWDREMLSTFAAVDPSVGVSWTTSSAEVSIAGRARAYPAQLGSALPLRRAVGSVSYSLTDQWHVGAQGGAGQLRLQTDRDNWWALPLVRWTPTNWISLEVQGGWTGRQLRADESSSWQTSTLGLVSGNVWFSDRLRGEITGYLGDGDAVTTETSYGTAGASAALTYWLRDALSLTAETTLEQVNYSFTQDIEQDNETVSITDELWRTDLEIEWTTRRGISVFARGGIMTSALESTETAPTDQHVSAGVRIQFSSTLARPSLRDEETGFWENTSDGVRFRVPYQGTGRVYVTGDFNNWADPGEPLRSTGNGTRETTLHLEPGRYEYSIRIIENDEEQWLEWPDEAKTVDDGFGGTNGVFIVE